MGTWIRFSKPKGVFFWGGEFFYCFFKSAPGPFPLILVDLAEGGAGRNSVFSRSMLGRGGGPVPMGFWGPQTGRKGVYGF